MTSGSDVPFNYQDIDFPFLECVKIIIQLSVPEQFLVAFLLLGATLEMLLSTLFFCHRLSRTSLPGLPINTLLTVATRGFFEQPVQL